MCMCLIYVIVANCNIDTDEQQITASSVMVPYDLYRLLWNRCA